MTVEPSEAAADPATALKHRLRRDLKAALTRRSKAEAMTLRSLIAAIDNGEAPPLGTGPVGMELEALIPGSAEVQRLRLTAVDVNRILLQEIGDREDAAAEMERFGRTDRADVLLAEARLARRYLEDTNDAE